MPEFSEEPQTKPPVSLDTLQFRIPDRFLKPSRSYALRKDKLVGLPIVEDEARRILAKKLTDSITEEKDDKGNVVQTGSNWACLYGDIDQLKIVNSKYGRVAGDIYIKWGTGSFIQGLDSLQISEDAEIFAMRPTRAADETVVWFFNLTTEDVEKLRRFNQEIYDQNVKMPDGSVFTFSSSYGLTTSSDEEIKQLVQETTGFVEKNKGAIAFELFEQVEERCSDLSKEEKIAKELTKLPIDQLFEPNHIDEFINLIANDFGGGRVSEHILEILLRLQAIKAVSSIDPEKYALLLGNMGVNKDELEQEILEAKTPQKKIEKMVRIFRGLFGEVND